MVLFQKIVISLFLEGWNKIIFPKCVLNNLRNICFLDLGHCLQVLAIFFHSVDLWNQRSKVTVPCVDRFRRASVTAVQ
jgi:hypothetical protein